MKFTLLVSIVVAAPYSTKPVDGKHSVIVNLKPFEQILHDGNMRLFDVEMLNYNSILQNSHVKSKNVLRSQGEVIRNDITKRLGARARELQQARGRYSTDPKALSVPVRYGAAIYSIDQSYDMFKYLLDIDAKIYKAKYNHNQ
ncbi:hypothetical protein DSO57_1036581 [Entomophthora muscae]|uniref:Uncharacterized protein n=1 Tax=Entomophthora muscae TaxID=34485 RepID=A0ACC2SNK6_9FUNG|nr:hypothetical protein DSO57_1036581 [Entomophthora muscae]